jgi:PAS domain S-box-containing protein
MNFPLRVLYLENDVAAAELVQDTLEKDGIACVLNRVETEADFLSAVQQRGFDLVLADYTLPLFDGLSALKIVRQQEPDVPFIFVSGTLGEDVAVEALKIGATDYVLKTRLSRLVPSVRRALRQAEEKTRREFAKEALHRAVVEANQGRSEALAAHQRFSDLVNSVEGIVWEADAQTFAFSFVSEQAERILGYPVEKWLREPTFWKDHLHPEDRDYAVQLCVGATAEKRGHDFEYRMIAGDGRVVWLRDLVTVVVENDCATQLRGVMIDIGERKQNENTLQEQANLLSLTHDAIFVFDMSATITYWNRGAEAMYGWTVAEASGQVSHLLLKTVFPVPREQIEAELMRAGRWEGELVHSKKDGTRVVVASRWSLQQNKAGTPIAILEINNDITEQKTAEQARQEIEEQWKAAFENNPTMYFIIDAAGGIVSVNAFGAEQLGYTVSELVGQPVLNIFWEPDRQFVQRDANSCFEQPGRMARWEARKIRKDGNMLWVRETANAVFLKDRLVLLVVCEDITEQKRAEDAARRSEKELREVIETIPAMAWSALPDGSNTFVNRQWAEFTGLSAVQSSGWENTVHPEDLDGHREKWRECLSSGQPFEHETRLRRTADGQYRWFLFRGLPLRDEQGRVFKWYGIATDIEDRKRAEALLSGEKRILEMVARGDSLRQILDTLCRLVEEQASGALASILLVDGDRLRHGGAPSLPKAYTDAIDGAIIGPCAGSCGTAAYRREQVIVENIEVDPLWADYREAALPYSLRACWSTPVFSSQGNVIATFAMYYREPRRPSLRDQEIIEQITHLAGVAIQRKLTQEALRRSEAYLTEAQELSHTGSFGWNVTSGKLYWSLETFRIFGYEPTTQISILHVIERTHPEDRAAVQQLIEHVSRERKPWDFEHRLLMPDGSVKYLHVTGHPSPSLSGKFEFVGAIIDITARKRAEERLRRSDAHLLEAQRLAHSGSWSWDIRTRESIWSQELFRIFGYDPEITKPGIAAVRERIHPEDVSYLDKVIERESSGFETHVVSDYRIVLPDGTIKHLHVVAHPVLNRLGEVVEIMGSTMDVTERKRAEEALRQSEAYLAEAQKLTRTGSWAGNLITRQLFHSSDEFVRLHGFDPGEGVPSLQDFYNRIHPQDEPAVRAGIAGAIGAGTDFDFEFRIVLSDGTVKYLHAIGHSRPSGEPGEYTGISVDVTERKRNEEALRRSEVYLAQAQRLTRTGSWAFSPVADRYVYWSEGMFLIWGFDSKQGLPEPYAALQPVHLEDRERTLELLSAMFEGHLATEVEADCRIVLPDRTVKYIHFTIHPVFDNAGEVVEYVGTVVDVTERRRAEAEREKLHQLEADLAHINRVSMMGELAASLAHEIRQPIAAAITSANACLRWLGHNPPDIERARAATLRIEKDATRTAEIINHLRSFYKKETPFQRELVNANEVIREMTDLLRNEATRHSISIRPELSLSIPEIMADRVQLQQVLMNLMLNAIEAMKDTAGELRITTGVDHDGQLLLSVSDTGVGLPAERADRIFDAFFTTKSQGTGMGLAITRSIVEAHGGRLWATPNDGPGATFHIALPRTAVAHA